MLDFMLEGFWYDCNVGFLITDVGEIRHIRRSNHASILTFDLRVWLLPWPRVRVPRRHD
jgi:hypothetical protein